MKDLTVAKYKLLFSENAEQVKQLLEKAD